MLYKNKNFLFKIFGLILATILFITPLVLKAEKPGCKYTAGTKYGFLGCWGTNKWCTI